MEIKIPKEVRDYHENMLRYFKSKERRKKHWLAQY